MTRSDKPAILPPETREIREVRTRIAPSPTGFPHVATLYQALFDLAWARKHNGTFIVRIEDTDRTRFVEGAEEAFYSAYDWAGLTEDESPRLGGEFGPYRQSDRLDIYRKHVDELVDKGHAYPCFCTKERLEELHERNMKEKKLLMYDKHCAGLSAEDAAKRISAGEEHVIRMRVPAGEQIVCLDGARGEIVFESSAVDDQVLLKSDGFPTYHLAVVVDDHLMKITHVVRGEEWISSLPKHVLLYRWFGWDIPEIYHTPILRNPDKSKMSKRQGHLAVSWYQEHGILPEALINFLALMGWSHPEGREVFSFEEFMDAFDLKDIQPGEPVFDLVKLEWMNGEYIRMMREDDLVERLFDFSKEYFEGRYPRELIGYTVPLVQTRLKTLQEFDNYCRFFIEAPTMYEVDLDGNEAVFVAITDGLERIDEKDWHADIIGEHLQAVAQDVGMPFGKFFMLVRVALTGRKITPPTNESMEILGKSTCLERLRCIL